MTKAEKIILKFDIIKTEAELALSSLDELPKYVTVGNLKQIICDCDAGVLLVEGDGE